MIKKKKLSERIISYWKKLNKKRLLKIIIFSLFVLLMLFSLIIKFVSPSDISLDDLDKVNVRYMRTEGKIEENFLKGGGMEIYLYGKDLPEGEFRVTGIYNPSKNTMRVLIIERIETNS